MTRAPDRTGRAQALLLLALLSASVFIAEAAVMFAMTPASSPVPGLVALLDASILTIALSPVFYFFVCKPLVRLGAALAANQERSRET